jgi:hypothetical protein
MMAHHCRQRGDRLAEAMSILRGGLTVMLPNERLGGELTESC